MLARSVRYFLKGCDHSCFIERILPTRNFSSGPFSVSITSDNYDKSYYLNPLNVQEILDNIKQRRLGGLLQQQLANLTTDEQRLKVFSKNLDLLPNHLHPRWKSTTSSLETTFDSFVISTFGEQKWFDFPPKRSENIARSLGQLFNSKFDNLGLVGGQRAYSLFGDIARLQDALIDWTIDTLVIKYGFTPIVVPNLVYEDVLRGCGYNPRTDAGQVYKVANGNENNEICLIGTSEIPLTALHLGHTFTDSLPKRYCCVSRCYRAEVKSISKESGMYRVPYFTKVEMYAFTEADQSDQVLEEFLSIQKYLFSTLGLHFRVIDMPPYEMGVSAYRKYDIEVWLQATKDWGEISSASNCTDFQARRFNIKYRKTEPNYETNEPFQMHFAHTVNGTACAVPRLLIAVLEDYQFKETRGGLTQVLIPEVLRPYMNHQEKISETLEIFAP